jgi:hypothetical protein
VELDLTTSSAAKSQKNKLKISHIMLEPVAAAGGGAIYDVMIYEAAG